MELPTELSILDMKENEIMLIITIVINIHIAVRFGLNTAFNITAKIIEKTAAIANTTNKIIPIFCPYL